jgi:uncharacterized protein
MSDEARNVEILKAAYTRWSDTKGESVDDWLKICADDIDFGSLAQGAAPKVQYLTAYSSRDALKEYFGGLARNWDMLDWHVDQFKMVSTPKADSWRLTDGKAVEYFEYYDTAQVHAAVA